MANPSASAAAAAAIRACLGVAFALLLLLASSSGLPRRRAQSADPLPSSPSVVASEARVLRAHEERCRADVAPGSDSPDRRHPGSSSGGYVDYLYLFYCVLGGDHRPILGYAALTAWLAVLFYLLADTAASYFCASLEGLARLLGLPPAIAGATLLSLGNGAPDALSAIASFAASADGDGDGDGGAGGAATPTAAVGLSGVLGGAMFVSSAVLGVIAVRLGGHGVAVHRASFFRDAAFLLLALGAVAVVVAVGEVTVWAAAGFASLYVVYVLAVAFTPDRWARRHGALAEDDDQASPAAAADFSELHNVTENKFFTHQKEAARDPLLPDTAPLLQYYAAGESNSSGNNSNKSGVFWTVLRILELPLSLPRRLTIPDAASKGRWSKPTAVTAATLAPVFLSLLWSHRATTGSTFVAVLLGGLAGLALGLVAFVTTDPSAPPTRFLGAWLAGGFAMSVAWAYVIASEVLSLLVSSGTILSVDSAALGVTVLAWGNSVSDLIANVAVASRSRGGGGAQVAVSGCYGGPVFNVFVGLGLSMLLSCWSGYPRPVEIPREPGLYRTLAFVVAGLLWAVVMLPRRGMRVDRTLGIGLLVIYFCFLCINISQLKNAR